MAKLVRTVQGLSRSGGMPSRPRWLDVVERFPPTHTHGRAAAVPVLDWPVPAERQLQILGLAKPAPAAVNAAAPGPSPAAATATGAQPAVKTAAPAPAPARTTSRPMAPAAPVRGPAASASSASDSAAAVPATPLRGSSDLDRYRLRAHAPRAQTTAQCSRPPDPRNPACVRLRCRGAA